MVTREKNEDKKKSSTYATSRFIITRSMATRRRDKLRYFSLHPLLSFFSRAEVEEREQETSVLGAIELVGIPTPDGHYRCAILLVVAVSVYLHTLYADVDAS